MPHFIDQQEPGSGRVQQRHTVPRKRVQQIQHVEVVDQVVGQLYEGRRHGGFLRA
jgi:hypothetical protein